MALLDDTYLLVVILALLPYSKELKTLLANKWLWMTATTMTDLRARFFGHFILIFWWVSFTDHLL